MNHASATLQFSLSRLTQLVPRERELRLFREQLNTRRNTRHIPGSIIHLVGTAGIGKTTLIEQIYKTHLNIEHPDAPWVSSNFDLDKHYLQRDGLVRLLNEWVICLAEKIQLSTGKFNDAVNAYYTNYNHPKESKSAPHQLESYQKQIADLFVGLVNDITEDPNHRPIVFFMDAVENIPQEFVCWLERYIIDPITAIGLSIFVLTSRKQVDWQIFDVRKRVLFHRILPFDATQVASQLTPSYGYLGNEIIKLSFGLPSATAALAEEIQDIQKSSSRPANDIVFQAHMQRLVQGRLLEQLLYGHVMKDVSAELRDALLVMSPLRHFTMNVVSNILPMFSPSFAHIASSIQIPAVIQDMLLTSLVEWDREKRGYSIEDPLRKIMALALMVKDAGRFVDIHRKAAELYASWINLNNQENRRDYIIEWLLHQAYVLHHTGTRSITDTLNEHLGKWINLCYLQVENSDWSALDALYNQLKSDDDLKQELEDIEQGAFDNILANVNKYRYPSIEMYST